MDTLLDTLLDPYWIPYLAPYWIPYGSGRAPNAADRNPQVYKGLECGTLLDTPSQFFINVRGL